MVTTLVEFHTRRPSRFAIVAAFLLAVVVSFTVYIYSSVETIFDSRWVVPTAESLIHDGDLDISEYDAELFRRDYWGTVRTAKGRYNFFPAFTSYAAAPIIAVCEGAPFLTHFFFPKLAPKEPRRAEERFAAAFIAALCAGVFFLVAKEEVDNLFAYTACATFAFATSQWSTVSRALWQHGPSVLLLSLALLLALKAMRSRHWLPLLGVLLGLAYVSRPTNAVPVLFFTVYIAFTYRVWLLPFLAGLAVPLVFFAIQNQAIYDAWLPPYFLPNRLAVSAELPWIVLGNLLSPGRGIFVFSPILLFAIPGAYLRLRYGTGKGLTLCVMACIAAHVMAISSYHHWWGGHSFGARLMSDTVPFFVFLALGVGIHRSRVRFPRTIAVVCLLLGAASLSIHYRGANHWKVWSWNRHPVNVDEHPERLWDWTDLQFLRAAAPRRAAEDEPEAAF